jgi:hypothetical protein
VEQVAELSDGLPMFCADIAGLIDVVAISISIILLFLSFLI